MCACARLAGPLQRTTRPGTWVKMPVFLGLGDSSFVKKYVPVISVWDYFQTHGLSPGQPSVLMPSLPMVRLADHDLWEVLKPGTNLRQLIQDFLAILGLWHFHPNLSQFTNFFFLIKEKKFF